MLNDDNPYFSVPHCFNAYLSPFDQAANIPTEAELKGMQSVGLKLMSEVKAQESNCLLQLRQIDNEAKAVVDYLKLQSRKIDLVLQYVLENEAQTGTCYQGTQFGGSGLRINSPAPMPIGHRFKLNLYMREELIAILCIAKVTYCKFDEEQQAYAVDLIFLQILEADIELLVKASLSVQQKQIRARKQARQD